MAVWLAMQLTDVLSIACLVVRGTLDLSNDKQGMCCTCGTAPLEIIFPIIHPTKLTVANQRIDHIILEIKAKGTTPIPGNHNVTEYAGLHNRFISMPFLRFYEQSRPHIQAIFGKDTQAWPQLFQFAWAIRNGLTHHAGRINFTNPGYPAVSWRNLSYSPADAGKPIFGSHFSVGDLFLLMFDISDELDAIAAPLPPD